MREQLEITLPRIGTTFGDLRFNPCWDDLRGDKRFGKIVAAAKAAQQVTRRPRKGNGSAALFRDTHYN
jgi:hypothetical protein